MRIVDADILSYALYDESPAHTHAKFVLNLSLPIMALYFNISLISSIRFFVSFILLSFSSIGSQ
ncbi:MAG: hypothetical protein AOA65_0768 [Candidatus Bathyarchaeota archaeon BA1]|nr:MAG: hypothetical protein AOA65_0768 [Candidatus Bathyarchaeota archaeon BA1]